VDLAYFLVFQSWLVEEEEDAASQLQQDRKHGGSYS
jgi:hypothetical protein